MLHTPIANLSPFTALALPSVVELLLLLLLITIITIIITPYNFFPVRREEEENGTAVISRYRERGLDLL